MVHLHKPKDGQRKSTPPGPTYMSDDQIASYLKDLRKNRPSRPNGSRPLPPKPAASTPNLHTDLPPRASSAFSHRTLEIERQFLDDAALCTPNSVTSCHSPFRRSLGSSAGRPLVQEPMSVPVQKLVSPTKFSVHATSVSPSATYREIRERQKEREEARLLRDALEEMDHLEERHLHQAAQDEATRLVWEHQHPGVPFNNPYAPYSNPDMLTRTHPANKSDYSRTYGLGIRGTGASIAEDNGQRSASNSSSGSSCSAENAISTVNSTRREEAAATRKKARVNFSIQMGEEKSQQTTHAHSSARSNPRKSCGDLSKGIFRNPNDQIYEEPETQDANAGDRHDSGNFEAKTLKEKHRNSLLHGSRPLPERHSDCSQANKTRPFEVKNQPTQSRNPVYKTNDVLPRPLPDEIEGNLANAKNRIEVRSAELRAATSKQLKDRSDSLPMPSAISDRPGRPIVSFNPAWKSTTDGPPQSSWNTPSEQKSGLPGPPDIAVPVIEISEAPPVLRISSELQMAPTISEIALNHTKGLGSSSGTKPKAPLPKSVVKESGPKNAQNNWRFTYTRAGVPTASCAACNLPIKGKVVTAAGCRFHPECFTCHYCHTALECVAFYQEPEAKRAERLSSVEDHDEEAHSPRFYCHLDYHEMFSPRCKGCKTPIEGEVVVACGAEWHVGHFFCAECGEPFTQTMPFVEKEGFAWCLRCHSRRIAPRCLGCKQPVLDEVVISAIGGQWHDKCFVCHECGNGFGPEGRFFVREGEPRKTAKGRIIGGPVQLAICETCEAIRLRASP